MVARTRFWLRSGAERRRARCETATPRPHSSHVSAASAVAEGSMSKGDAESQLVNTRTVPASIAGDIEYPPVPDSKVRNADGVLKLPARSRVSRASSGAVGAAMACWVERPDSALSHGEAARMCDPSPVGCALCERGLNLVDPDTPVPLLGMLRSGT